VTSARRRSMSSTRKIPEHPRLPNSLDWPAAAAVSAALGMPVAAAAAAEVSDVASELSAQTAEVAAKGDGNIILHEPNSLLRPPC